jgi:hypothetical protein
LDPIPTTLLYENIEELLPTITKIINDSLITGTVPNDFKTALVRPLLKKKSLDPENLKNYRPISNLPFLSKLLEKVVLQQLLAHLNANNLCNPFQSAYRSGHSTETTLLRVVSDLLMALDKNRVSVLLLLDLSAAFDTVDHDILISRLTTNFGVRSKALDWFKSYLWNRRQFISVANLASSPKTLDFGVPQGSVLGPILFVLYTTPLSKLINDHAVNHQLFADDTQLHKSSSPASIDTLPSTMHACTTDIKTWMNTNQLKLNDDKTEAMIFTPPVGLNSDFISVPTGVKVGSHFIPFCTEAKNLGVIIDPELSMKEHVKKVCQLANYELRRIGAVRKHLSREATQTLVTSCILSRLDYCNSLLMGCDQTTIQPMQLIQNWAARLVLGAPRRAPATPLLRSLHWLPISERIKYKVGCICYNVLTDNAPSYLKDILPKYTNLKKLRSAADDRLLARNRFSRKTHGYRSLHVYGPIFWNKLPHNIRHSPSVDTFKTRLKTYLFDKHFS